MGVKGSLRASSFGFFDRCSYFGLTLAENNIQFPHGSPPTGVYGHFGGHQIIESFVGTCQEIHYVLWGTDTSGSGNSSNWGDAGRDVL